MLMKAGTKVAESAARRRSHASASERPAPAAAPFTAATTGFSRLRRPRIVRWYVLRRRWAMSPADSRNSVRSWPTQNPRPAPVTTTARTSSARASLNASCIARCMAPLKAFSTSGRFSVIVRTPSSRLVSTSAMRARVLHLRDAPYQEAPLDGVRRQVEGTPVRGGRVVHPARPPQQVGPRGVEEVVALQPLDRVDELEAALRSLRERDRDGAVQLHDRARVEPGQPRIKRCDPRPIGV